MSTSPSDPLADSAANWEIFAQEDPLWSILADPSKQGGRWEIDEFLATGEGDVVRAMAAIDGLGEPVARQAALDFGCGVGRLVFALARRFAEVAGVDAAPAMIARARQLNRMPERVRLVQSAAPALPFADASFDFVHSHLVLQHIPTDAALGYVREFVRVLRPRGATYFTLPAQFAHSAGRQANETRFTFAGRDAMMWMHAVPVAEVATALESAGAVVERVDTFRTEDQVLQAAYVARRNA
jgi:ubiquinone/menaquinone biosynthesis C-methylase UbiE